MIEVNDRIALDEDEIRWEFIRASGPGGQKVNKASTAVQLRFDVSGSPSLPEQVRRRLMELAGSRLTKEDILVIEARCHRSQEQNRRDALDRLIRLIQKAAKRPRVRRKSRPSVEARRRRLDAKRRRGEIKRLRRPVRSEED